MALKKVYALVSLIIYLFSNNKKGKMQLPYKDTTITRIQCRKNSAEYNYNNNVEQMLMGFSVFWKHYAKKLLSLQYETKKKLNIKNMVICLYMLHGLKEH